MSAPHWFSLNDQHASIAFERIRDAVGPLLAEVFPDFRVTHVGINRRPDKEVFIDGRDEITLVLHLRPLGEAFAIDERIKAAGSNALLEGPL